MLQQAVGKTAGRGAHVETGLAVHIDVPMLKRLFQFESAAAHVLVILAQQADFGVYGDCGACLFDLLAVYQHPSGEDECLRARPRGARARS